MKRLIWLLFVANAWSACTTGGSGFCEVGSGKTYSTVQACATAMSAGQTCLVFAGTYNENVTVTAGGVGSYKTITVNGSDVVSVYSFTLNSHTKLIGNCVQPAAAGTCGFNLITATPLSAPCVTVPDSSTDIYITNNVMTSCGSGASATEVQMQGTNGVSYIYIQGNTMSYGCGTAVAPNNCSAIGFSGNHVLIENNDFSHFGLAVESYGQYVVIRNNKFHDMNESECGAQSGNCHLDIIYSERSNTVAAYLVQYQLWEGNVGNTVTGADGKGLWTAADNPGGCGTSCFNVIGRYNVLAHFGSGTAAQTSGFLNVKFYNNTTVDPGMSAHGSNSTDHYRDDGSTGGAEINNLFYYPFSVPQAWGWAPYYLNSTGNDPGFTAGANLAYCSSSPCSLLGRHGAVNGFPTDSPVIASNIVASSDPLVNYAGGDYHLSSSSQARNAGTYLTTTVGAGTGTSLTVADAGFFQDGLGLTAAGVHADWIRIGTTTTVQVSSINYATNVITLASSVSWSNADPVYLYAKSDGVGVLTGSSPDVGAYPFISPAGMMGVTLQGASKR